MDFSDSAIFACWNLTKSIWEKNSIYYLVLGSPVIIIFGLMAFIFSLVIDILVACISPFD